MLPPRSKLLVLLLASLLQVATIVGEEAKNLPVRVYVLAGQSNMEGKGSIEMLTQLLNDQMTRAPYQHLVDENHTWVKRENVKVYFPEITAVPESLTVGLGYPTVPPTPNIVFPTERFGVELEFGRIVGDAYPGPTLLIKTAWGGADLAVDFRSVSMCGIGTYTNWEQGVSRAVEERVLGYDDYGRYYKQMLDIIKESFQWIESGNVFEGYDTYELKGFLWWQGWNDLISAKKLSEYDRNLKCLIRSVRRDLNKTDLPFVIGEAGQDGVNPELKYRNEGIRKKEIRRRQRSVAFGKEFHNTTRFVMTSTLTFEPIEGAPMYDGSYHYYGSAEVFVKVGQLFGETMLQLLEDLDYFDSNAG